MLYNVQVLRAVASLLVVHAHAASVAGLDLMWSGGANGVDLFFVISGFIIAYVASLDTDQFMVRRLIRIVPIYWSSTIAIYLLVLVMPNLFRTTSSDPVLLIRSLLFLPTGSNVHTDGIPHPTLGGGWTLNYEMYFYVVFAISLALSSKRATMIAVAILIPVIMAVQLTDLKSNPIAAFYGDPIVLEFVFGMIAFHIVRELEARRSRRPPHSVEKLLLAFLIVAGLLMLAFTHELFGEAPRWIVSGIPSFVIVVSAILLERLYDLKVTNRAAVAIGDASYVLYLVHAYIVFGVIRLVIRSRHFSDPVGQLATIGLMAVSAIIAILVYRYFEQPILRFLKRRLVRSRPRASKVSSAAAPRASSR
jgi:peptidoglycan/LPS O-acetylase OafA/YrhL